jgi:hypothetical protein
MVLVFTNLFLLAGLGTTIANYSTSVIQGEANVEKSINIDINDFYFGITVPTIFTTGDTNGTEVTGNNTSTCGITVTGLLGHTNGDISGGFRVNNNTLHLRISFGSKTFVGISGQVYTTTSRSLRISKNTTPGTVSYNKDVSSTYTTYSISPFASVLNTPVTFNRIDLSPSLTGEIELRASGSVGFTNLTIYYLD